MTRLRVTAHVHSEWSHDAAWSLTRLAASFARRGIDAVLMCEHDQQFDARRWRRYQQACAAASTDRILLVPGLEYSDAGNAVHIPVWGDVPFLGSGTGTAALLRNARSEGGFTVFAHPWRRDAWRYFDDAWLEHLSAVEVWNRKYDGVAPRADALALARRAGLAPFVSLDFHTRRQFFPLALGIDVDAGTDCAVTPAAIHDALGAGRFEPLVFSTSALRFTDGVAGRAAQALERIRRRVAHPLARDDQRRTS